MCCSWTNCDWIGDNDDLIDHIMEIHVELQPYHNLKDIISSSMSSSGCSSSSPDASTNHELIPTATNGNDDDTSNSMSASNNHINCQMNDNCRKSKANETIDIASTVDQQTQLYVCLWEGCKVYGKGSLSKSWIERHVLQHSGPRPFKCIVEGCNQRFKKREALERHVNSHFLLPINDLSSSLPNLSSNLSPTLNGDHTQGPAKMSPRNGPSGFHLMTSSSLNRNKLKKKRVKARKKYISSRASEDYFDESIMELINFRLTEISMLTGLDVLGNHSDLVFHSKVIGKCCPEKDGATKVLLRWEPEGIMPDEWISESDLNEMSSRRIPLKSLPIDSLNKILEETSERRTRGRKFRKD